jgi:hypothetical protein
VVIEAPGTFGFEALEVDPNDPNTVLALGVFQEIVVDPNCPQGTVNLYVARDPNEGGGPGAIYVYYLKLLEPNNPVATANIAEARVTGTLPDLDATAITGPVVAEESIGNVTVDYLGGDITTAYLGDVTVSRGLTDRPTITVNGEYEGAMSFVDLPALVITGDLVGTVYASGDADSFASVTVSGTLGNDFRIDGECDRSVTLRFGSLSGAATLWLGHSGGDPFPASIVIDGNLGQYQTIKMYGGLDADGSISAGGTWNAAFDCYGDLAGRVLADSFGQ